MLPRDRLSDAGEPSDAAGHRASTATAPVTRSRSGSVRLVVQTDRRLPLVAVNACYLSGARHDPAGRSGLAHLTEHLVARHRARGDSRKVPVRGGIANASTTHDRTSFTQLVPMEALADALDIHARRIDDALTGLTRESVITEREILRQERFERIDNQPYGRSLEILQSMLFPKGHSYCRPAAGDIREIDGIDLPDVEQFMAAHYTPANLVLALVGHVSPADAGQFVDAAFAHLPATVDGEASETHSTPVDTPIIKPDTHRHVLVEDDVPGTRIFQAFRTDGFGTTGSSRAALLIRSLALGRACALKQRLIHAAGLASDLQAFTVSFRDATLLAIAVTAAPGVERTRLEEAFEHALHQGLTTLPSPRSLESARAKALTDYYSIVQRLDARADRLSSCVGFTGNPDGLSIETRHWIDCQPADLLEAGYALSKPERRAVLTMVPRGTR